MINLLKLANLTLSFLLELCMLAAFGYWGFRVGPNLLLKIIFAIAAPLGVAVFWGIWMAPTSARRLTAVPRLIVQALLFGLASWALVSVGQVGLALGLGGMAAVNIILTIAFGQEK